jgi:hypothetical protein
MSDNQSNNVIGWTVVGACVLAAAQAAWQDN